MTKAVNLALHLTQQIETGRYKVGQPIPTEAELQQRFDVSRHTVREALRDLKSRGLVLARPGVGTVVRSRAPNSRFMQGIGTLNELIQFAEAMRMKVLKRRVVIADAALAGQLAVKAGQEWHVASVLRFQPKDPAPVTWMDIYVRPEHSDVLELIDSAGQPVFSLIERHHGERIAEVRQEIVATNLERAAATVLKAKDAAPALHIVRQYFDARDRLVMASVGLYPSDRFSHNTRFRIHNTEDKESP
jgi:GntR family transcriptional regulator